MNNVLNQIMPYLRLRGCCRRSWVWEGRAQRAVPMTCPGCSLALPQQCQPHPSCLFFWEPHHCRATPHSYGVWTPVVTAEPELINPLFPGLHWIQRQRHQSLLNSSFTLVLKPWSSSGLPLHGHSQGGMLMDRHQVCTPRAGEGTGSGGSVIWGGEHIWTMRASALQSGFASKAQL